MYKPLNGQFMAVMMARDFRAACMNMPVKYAVIRQWRKMNRLAVDRVHR